MQIERTLRFRKAYRSLTDDERQRVKKAIALLADDWRRPGLGVKRVLGKEGVWEARASLSLRITFELDGDTITLRSVGAHDATLRDA
jgi:mRNA interferase RelE/StbE